MRLSAIPTLVSPPPQLSHVQSPLQRGTMPGKTTRERTMENGTVHEPSPPSAILLPTSIIVATPSGTEAILRERIVTCRAEGKNTAITCVGDLKPRLVFHGLAELLKLFGGDKRFVQCHRSLVLNLALCSSWKHDGKEAIAHLTFDNSILENTVSRTYKAAFVQAWTEFMQK